MENNKQKPPIISVDFFEDVTGDISKSTPKSVEEIGIRIKSVREEKGLSLDQLSKLTGFDVELLSNIESSKVQPQLGTIIKLSKALDSAFGRIVSGVGDKLYSVTRKNEQKTVSLEKMNKRLYQDPHLERDVNSFILIRALLLK